MTTTAEEYWKERKEKARKFLRPMYDQDVHFKPDSYGEDLAISAMVKYAELIVSEKLREAEAEVSELKCPYVEGNNPHFYWTQGANEAVARLSPKIAALKAELNYYKNILYSSSPESMKAIAQLQAEKDALIETVRKDTEQIGKLQAESKELTDYIKSLQDQLVKNNYPNK